ncbi:MAG: transglutaminase domain-containing protein [Fidelibacterota bacterium]|nr:MAG: transglutaminase domain-containing protein [Candidatus Neomarinimicrobiota bacterium]
MKKLTVNPMRKARVAIIPAVLAGMVLACTSQSSEDHLALIEQGEFRRARAAIEARLQKDTGLTPVQRLELQFEIERLERIKKDFNQTEEEVIEYIKAVIPDADAADLRRWEKNKALEYKIIDGEKRYFELAGRNLFRIDRAARAEWNLKAKSEQPTYTPGTKLDLNRHDQRIIDAALRTGKIYVEPVRLRIRQSVEVHENMVPEGEIIRCWIPFPREIPARQGDIRLLATEPAEHIIADKDIYLQRTIYFEKPSRAYTKIRFEVEYEYTSRGAYAPVDADRVQTVELTPELAPYVQEEPPHIVFTPALRELSREIVGAESNPYLIARRLYEWVDTNIPWASAREYSTIRNLSSYAYENMHGDCGIRALLFITLCRMNGIPARWQSGWEFQPPDDSMHDWGMIYFELFGWIPMDVDYGLRNSVHERLKWFYLSGMDSYRLVFNDAYSQPLYPAKIYPRSETVDSQRGEVEWRGGNLYYDQWDWELEWEVIE